MFKRVKCWTSVFLSVSICAFAQPYIFPENPQDLHQKAIEAYKGKEWKEAVYSINKIIDEHPGSPFIPELYFYGAVANYHLGHYDFANNMLSVFLEKYALPKFFEDAVVYKFHIGEKFYHGEKTHLFGLKRMPKWGPSKEVASEIFDEVINTLPRHEVTAKALLYKGHLQREIGKEKVAIEAYQTLTRRFPKHPLGPEAYLAISETYLAQANLKFPDPNILDAAKINYKKFVFEYPGEERTKEVKEILAKIVDRYAEDLWYSAIYYDKKRKVPSAVLYYQSILTRYPESNYAHDAMKRLLELRSAYPKENIEIESYVQLQNV